MKTKIEIVLRTFVFSGSLIAVQFLAVKMPEMGIMFNTLATTFFVVWHFSYFWRN